MRKHFLRKRRSISMILLRFQCGCFKNMPMFERSHRIVGSICILMSIKIRMRFRGVLRICSRRNIGISLLLVTSIRLSIRGVERRSRICSSSTRNIRNHRRLFLSETIVRQKIWLLRRIQLLKKIRIARKNIRQLNRSPENRLLFIWRVLPKTKLVGLH